MAENKPTSSSNTSDRSSRFVLIVDDDDKNLSYTSMLVKRLGYHILKAATGEQALATAAGLVPSLIIISLDLAGLSGFKLMRQLKNSSATSHIPFVGLISRDNRDLKDRCFEHGAAGYLCRPIEADMLYRTVQAAIEKNPRTSVRVRAVLPVKVYGNANDSLYGAYTLALSTGGMFLRTMNPVSVNSEISLEFDLNGRAIAAETVVLYNCQAGGGSCRESGIGLRFVDISPKDREIIREFIRNEVLKDISCGS
jgi:CheY-like chemotaxis protein/Tfp pilus assembly protein PilZ